MPGFKRQETRDGCVDGEGGRRREAVPQTTVIILEAGNQELNDVPLRRIDDF